jgi:hypothetical protein
MNASIQKKSAEIRDWPLVSWWIRVTSPAPGSPAYGRNPQWREEVAGLILLIEIVLLVIAILGALDRPITLIVLSASIIAVVVAIFLKRAGMLHAAGIVVIIVAEFGLCSAILFVGTLDGTNFPTFDLFAEVSLAAMAFFPPLAVFLVTFLNCFFTIFAVNLLPHTVALNHVLAQYYVFIVVVRPITFQLFVAGVSFIMIRALTKEIKRADNAEEIAQLKQSEAELRRREAEQAQQLEEGIQLILQALNTAAGKGDFSMRVPLAQENILWRVGYSINNLLARLQGFKQEKMELDKTRAVASQLTDSIRQGRHFPLNQWTGTSLDQLIIEINKQLVGSAKRSD